MSIKQLIQTTVRSGKYQYPKAVYAGYTCTALGYQSTRWISHNVTFQNIENYHQQDSFLLQSQLITSDHNALNCSICHQSFTTSYYPLSFKSKNSLKDGAFVCVGCRRFFGQIIDNKQDMWKMIAVLLSVPENNNSGDYRAPTVLQQFNYNQQYVLNSVITKQNAKGLRKRMKKRCVNKYMKWMAKDDADFLCDCEIPTHNELMDLKKQNTVCAISGIPGTWNHTDEDLFKLTIDHKIPVSKNGAFGKDNLQVTLKPINFLKDSESNSETSRYIAGLRKNYRRLFSI